MTTAKIDIAERLERLAGDAYEAKQMQAGDALAQAARMFRGALAAAEAKETLRDRLAMAALPGVMAWPPEQFRNPSFTVLAETAYSIADAMMAARQIGK